MKEQGNPGIMDRDATLFVAGGETLIGAAILRELSRGGYTGVIPASSGPNLCDRREVDAFFNDYRPEYVFVAAGKSGGILANTRYPAELMLDNLLSAANVIHSAHTHRVKKLLYLASSCSYPKAAPQPLRPESLMTGPLEPTNAAYATAKLAGIALCEAYRAQYGDDFIAGIPANAFGPGDDFSEENSHVVGGLIRRMHAAKVAGAPAVTIWGTGEPRREFVFADDIAQACIHVMKTYTGDAPINLGSGENVSIRELAELVRDVVGYAGELRFDTGKPDGMPLKTLDSSALRALGWNDAPPLRDALDITYKWFLQTKQGGQNARLVTAETVRD